MAPIVCRHLAIQRDSLSRTREGNMERRVCIFRSYFQDARPFVVEEEDAFVDRDSSHGLLMEH